MVIVASIIALNRAAAHLAILPGPRKLKKTGAGLDEYLSKKSLKRLCMNYLGIRGPLNMERTFIIFIRLLLVLL